jgi:hypothetical protein
MSDIPTQVHFYYFTKYAGSCEMKHTTMLSYLKKARKI